MDDQKSWNVTGIPPAEAFLFAATHGISPSLNWSRQESDAGAYIRQEWSGAAWNGNPRPFRFAGKDLTDDKNPSGMIAIFFACYGAGMPKMKEFRQKDSLIGDPAVRMAVA